MLRALDGEITYFASDIAYHLDKRERGFERQLIDVLGADHHGYVERMKAAFSRRSAATPDELELLIMQFVHLVSSAASAPRCPSAAATSSRSTS